MSKTTNLQKVECLKEFLEQLKRNRKYQKPKTTMQDLVDVKSSYAYKSK
jgi:hypothetical protein